MIGKRTVAALVVLVALVATGGIVAAAELLNETVDTTNDTESIDVTIDANETFAGAAAGQNSTTADVTFYDADEYANDSANATALLTDSISVDEGDSNTTAYVLEDESALDQNASYQVVVDGDANDIASASVALNDGSSGGLLFGADGGLTGTAIVLGIIVGGAIMFSGKNGSNGGSRGRS
ncbi:hypothetical protein ACFQMM_01125 [Saliphagus sp. GCM10025308]